jgi:hypothetical protein
MTENNESKEGEEKSETLSERVGVEADRAQFSRWKRVIKIRRENPRLQSWDESPHGSQPLKPQQLRAHTSFL